MLLLIQILLVVWAPAKAQPAALATESTALHAQSEQSTQITLQVGVPGNFTIVDARFNIGADYDQVAASVAAGFPDREGGWSEGDIARIAAAVKLKALQHELFSRRPQPILPLLRCAPYAEEKRREGREQSRTRVCCVCCVLYDV